jgi:hypothetical protein
LEGDKENIAPVGLTKVSWIYTGGMGVSDIPSNHGQIPLLNQSLRIKRLIRQTCHGFYCQNLFE